MNIIAAEKSVLAAFRGRSERGASEAGALFGLLVGLALILGLKGWALMIAWGIVASIVGIATISFWPAVAVAVLLSLALGTSISTGS